MDKKVTFSIITVVFNDREGLIRTAESISTQKCMDFEWIVVDGNSSDGTLNLLNVGELNISKYLIEADDGIYDAMNKGVKLSTGKYAVFMNAGDVFDGDMVLTNVKEAIYSSNRDNLIVYGGASLCFPTGRNIYRAPKDSEKYIWHGLPANHQATYYPVGWLMQNPYSEHYRLCGDYYLAVLATLSELKPLYLDYSLVRFRVGDTSYRHPAGLVVEAFHIQKRILKSSLFWRLLSSLRRSAAISITILIYNFQT